MTLVKSIPLGSRFVAGATIHAAATGLLAMHGDSHLVRFALSARRDGSDVQAAGSIPVEFSTFNIQGPQNYGAVGSLADHGVAEFLLEFDPN